MKHKKGCLKLLLLAILYVGVMSTPNPAQAQGSGSDPLKLDIKGLTQQADLILIGQAADVSSRFTTNEFNDQLIVSNITIKPEEVLKGKVAQEDSIILQNLLGGTVDGLSLVTSIDPFFAQGEQVVLFMKEGADSLQVVGGDTGKFSVDEAGQVPELGWSLEQLRDEILSNVTGLRLYLPLILKNAPDSTASTAQSQRESGEKLQSLYIPSGRRWPGDSPVVEYFINNPGFNDASAGVVADQNAAINLGANTWNAQGRANFSFSYGGVTPINIVDDDGNNVVIVRDATSNSGRVAGAYCWFNSSNIYVDCDIVFFDESLIFSIDGSPGTYDIWSVTVEEFGHWVGLAHSGVPGSSINGATAPGTISDRTLHLDDIKGITSIYGLRMIWDDQTPAGNNNGGDLFGSTLVLADFFMDTLDRPALAVGAPGEAVSGSGPNAGAVYLFASAGSTFANPTLLTQSPAGVNESGDRFGSALAAGDFNNDTLPDLAVSAPGENDNGSGPETGVVFVFSNGVGGLGSPLILNQSPVGANEAGDRFGSALAVGDFNGDNFDDLAVSATGEDLSGSGPETGAVFIFSGSTTGLGSPVVFGQGSIDINEAGDRFGSALAVGDFNGDNFDDLAVSAPGENVNGSGSDAGVVFAFFGSKTGLANPVILDQSPAGVNESGDHFGSALATGDFDGNGFDDLAVGAEGEILSETGPNEGAVFIFSGSTTGLSTPVVIGQGPVGSNEAGDRFGSALAAGDFNNDGFDELVIGARGEDFEGSGSDAGVVFLHQFNDDSGGNQDTMMVFGQAPAGVDNPGDRFGSALAAVDVLPGPFGAAREAQLVIGSPGESLNGSGADTGAFFYWR